jgi:uncharacterized zinc-type alcohol dehydrogenase-like protein
MKQEASLIRGFAALRPGAVLEPRSFDRAAPLPTEIEIAVTHCGICHSDLHLIDNNWGVSIYPFVPGHEIVGTVLRTGAQVSGLRAGQRVGVGWLAGSCRSCEQCAEGNENLCRAAQPTCVGRNGGFAESVRVDARFAAPIPEALPAELAAPLFCAGITVFAPLRRYIRENSRVGVIGLGGLGHLAVRYARAMGCGVTVFSRTADKEQKARDFGADRFVDASRTASLEAEVSTCDFILSTVPVSLPWAEYVNVLKPDGRLCVVGASPGDIQVPAIALIDGQKSIGGSAIGSNAEIRVMLEFSAAHGILPEVELFSMAEVNRALARLRENNVRYRAVLANEA